MDNDGKCFGAYLKELIKEANMTHTAFYTSLGITKPYFYDIVSGKSNPPPPRLQFKVAALLRLDDTEKQNFFDIAAKERGEMPADISKAVTENPQTLTGIRNYLRQIASGK